MVVILAAVAVVVVLAEIVANSKVTIKTILIKSRGGLQGFRIRECHTV
jgi:hypothetical protein